jgi:hypothetical protein
VNFFRIYILTSLIYDLNATLVGSRTTRRMVQFAVRFPDAAMVSALPTPLSWSHMDAILALKTPQARQFDYWSSDVGGCKL